MSASITLQARRLHATSTLVGIQVLPTAATDEVVHPQPAGHHMALLLDTSGSMEGERLEAVKRTLQVFIQHLKDDDRLTLIEWNSTARILCHACSDRAVLNAYVHALRADGGTNMEAALLQLATLSGESLDAVFLFTDGHINHGRRSPNALADLLEASLGTVTPLMALGFGEDHNADMLQGFAVRTRGTYTFADGNSKEMIPAVLGNLLGELESRVGIQATVTWVGTPEALKGVQCLELGTKHNNERYWMGNLIADKPQWVVCSMPPDITEVCLTWKDRTGTVQHCRAPVVHSDTMDPDVLEQTHRVEVVRLLIRLKSNNIHPMIALPKLMALERTLQTSEVSQRPLVLQLLAEVRAAIQRVDRGQGGGSLVRYTSNLTTFAMQRGLLSQHQDSQATVALPEVHTLFNSPRQIHRREAMVSGFSQTQIETPFHFPA